ncbi:MAG: hypothetical protein H0X29_07140, partial [Parachlamydiaceae bacterium]|nr:hypothetical protein [Parachlamydiaceae bacterium]
MKMEVKVPPMGESINEATIGTILKPAGTLVAADDELIELETDKVNQILYAPIAGIISWDVKPEDVVKIGQTLGSIESSKEASPVKQSPVTSPDDAPSTSAPAAEASSLPAPSSKPAPLAEVSPIVPANSERITTPEARSSKESFIAELSTPAKQTPLISSTPKTPAETTSAIPPQALQMPASASSNIVSERVETRKK